MEKEALEKLLADQPKDIRGKAILLFNGMAKNAVAYQEASTANNLRDWEAAQAAFEKYVAQIGITEPTERPLVDLADVLAYLQGADWKVTKPTLYRHHKEVKIAPRPDGTYALKDVEKYARTWLKQQSTGKLVREKLDELQRKRAEQDLKTSELAYDRNKHAYDIARGLYVLASEVSLMLAARAGVLVSKDQQMIQANVGEYIRIVHGDPQYAADFVSKMLDDSADKYHEFASTPEYLVIIDGEEDEDAEE